MTRKIIANIIAAFCIALLSWSVAAKEIPMWEGVKKTAIQKQADREYIAKIRKLTNGNISKGANRAIRLGWQFVAQKQTDKAIRRFNQAWLLVPNNPNIHWGFAVSTHLQGKPLEFVERHFRKAERLKRNDPSLFADHGRILEERGHYKKAITYFKKALAINPDLRDAHVGMWLASKKLGDKKTADKHRKMIR